MNVGDAARKTGSVKLTWPLRAGTLLYIKAGITTLFTWLW